MDQSDLEAELIKRNREIAKARDDTLKAEKRVEEAQLRNDDLLERVAELDGDCTKRNSTIAKLEAHVAELEANLVTAVEEVKTMQARHQQHLDSLRGEFEVAEKERQKEDEDQDALKKQISDSEEQRAELERKLGVEQMAHQATRQSLQQAEAAMREAAGASMELRRRIKELEEEMAEKEGALSAAQAQALDEERAKASTELHRVTALLEEQKGASTDLEEQTRDQERQLTTLRAELEDAQRDMAAHSQTAAQLESARDEAMSEYKQHKASQEEVLQAERKRNEEALNRANQQAATLDGRLGGQRLLLEEASQSLARTEKMEEQVSAELSEKVRELTSEHEEARDALERERAATTTSLAAKEALHAQALETELVVVRRNARAEMDAATHAESEVSEQRRRLEARLTALTEDQSESAAQHTRMQESLRTQAQGLRERLAEAEERSAGLQQDADRLKKDLEEARQEAERASMAHRLEAEKMQQALEAEGQSRSSADKVAQSKLEEKDTLLEHRVAACDRLEKELEDTRQKIGDMEQAAVKAREDADTRVHAVGVRVAELEGEIRKRQERVTEAEGRLDAQRQYLEQLSSTLSEAQGDRDALMATKSSLENQLQLEQCHKDAVSASLQDTQAEAAKRNRELEERIALDRDAHEAAMEDAKRAVSQELRQTTERLTSVETELASARERCELLMRNKADLQQEVGQQRERYTALEAGMSEHRAEKERLGLELEQAKQSKSALEEELMQLRAERQDHESKIRELTTQAGAMEAMRNSLSSDFSDKVRELDNLIEAERERREAAEKAVSVCRDDAEVTLHRREQDLQRANQDLQAVCDSWREKAEEHQALLAQRDEQAKSQRARVDEFDVQRREMEAALRGEAAAADAKVRRLEVEVQKAQAAVEETKADAAHEKATMTTRVVAMERQLEQEEKASRDARSAKEASESMASKKVEKERELTERLGMASEELFTRQVAFTLEKQRLSGALEESRRTLRNSISAPSPVAAADNIRVQGLEKQLAEERRKSIEQAVAIQRSERRCNQLDDSYKQSEAQRSDAAQRAREAERRATVLEEDLRKAQLRQDALDQKNSEVRESAAMSAAEMSTIRYESKYESAKLRGALDELRYMLKLQDPVARKPALGSM